MKDQDKQFTDFAEKITRKFFEFYPMSASSLGIHEYDGIVNEVSEESIRKQIEEFGRLLEELKKIEFGSLSVKNKFEYEIAKWGIESTLFELTENNSYRKNPMTYAFMFGDLHYYISRNYAPFEERIKSVVKIIDKIPSILKSAETLLDKKLPEIFCRYAKSFSMGYEDFFKSELLNVIKENVNNISLIDDYIEKSDKAVKAFEKFVEFVEKASDIKNEDYRTGKDYFEKMLRIKEHVYIPADELKKLGESELSRLQSEMDKILRENDFEGKIETLEHNHPSEETLIEDTNATLNELTDFIRQNNIVNLPDKLNCIVTEMPRYMNFGFAAMGSAGPYEKSDESFYYVNFPDKTWDDGKREQWMTQFNYPTLKLISIHEAYPGHYTHFLNSNEKSSKLSNLFMSYSYVEGWAHYTEEMMIEKGYDKENFKTKIGQLLEALIRCCRYIVSIGIHCENMTIEEAKNFFMKNAHMAEITALQEAERGAFDPGYLNYTLGKIFLKKLKDKYISKFDGIKTEKDFHDKVVSLGSPTYGIAEKYILEEI
ncbi:MAG: hypothetical protein HGGPFJEG_01138 [Ignavibacteria bacterium]|nr:hypothetical protein [Ignavibacteria bacterium]